MLSQMASARQEWKQNVKRLGNAIDPFTTLDKYGSDATRWYMISNAQPWDNLKFDLEGIDECAENSLVHFSILTHFLHCMQISMVLLIKKKISPERKARN